MAANNHMKDIMVPREPFARIILQWCAAKDTDPTNAAKYAGVTDRAINNVLWPNRPHIHFDKADWIVCTFGSPGQWLYDPELREIYQNVNLRRIDFAYPTSPKVEEGFREMIDGAMKRGVSYRQLSEDLGVGQTALRRIHQHGPKAPVTHKDCLVCGKRFKVPPKANKTVCCSTKCREERAQVIDKERRARRRANLPKKECAVCGKTFKPKTEKARSCSKECRGKLRMLGPVGRPRVYSRKEVPA